LLTILQIIDKGSQPLSNFEVLAHINSLESKYEDQKRTETIPEGVQKAMRDVSRPVKETLPPLFSRL
jgi:hypothetical protein